MPKVSVIVPCYNQAEYLSEALTSVLNQTFLNWECIIVNDGSTDNTEEVALEWIEKDNRFRYLKKENAGLPEARNYGILQSKGSYILPLDADDRIGTGYLEEAVKILENKNDVGIVYCDAEFLGEKTGKWDLPDFSLDGILQRNLIFCSAMFRKSDYIKVRGYNSNMIYGWEDWDFWLSIIENGGEVYKLQDVQFYYRIKSRNSMIEDLNSSYEKRVYSMKNIYFNHIELYFNKHGNPIDLYKEVKRLQISLEKTLHSKDYILGNYLLSPFRFCRREIKRHIPRLLNLPRGK